MSAHYEPKEYNELAPMASSSDSNPASPFKGYTGNVPGITTLLSQLKSEYSPTLSAERFEQEDFGFKKPVVGSKEWMRLRRENHKEVERKRRECINTNINILGEMVPGPEKNKGGILNRVIAHIQELRDSNARLKEEYSEDTSHLQAALQDLSFQLNELREENLYLKTRLGGSRAHSNLAKAT
ncbi:basic helix-loop-helix protein [Entomophthora muscae]|nr:basic helix-loop-helix protein [Entomophthora muscae]